MSQKKDFKFLEVAVILEIEKKLQKKFILAKNVVYTSKKDLSNYSQIFEEAQKIGITSPFGFKWTFSHAYEQLEELIIKEDFIKKYINSESLPEQEISKIKENYKELLPMGNIKKIYFKTTKNSINNYQTTKAGQTLTS